MGRDRTFLLYPNNLLAEQAMFSGQADIAMKTARQLEDMLQPGEETRWAREGPPPALK